MEIGWPKGGTRLRQKVNQCYFLLFNTCDFFFPHCRFSYCGAEVLEATLKEKLSGEDTMNRIRMERIREETGLRRDGMQRKRDLKRTKYIEERG